MGNLERSLKKESYRELEEHANIKGTEIEKRDNDGFVRASR